MHELISLQRVFETAMRGYKDPVESEKSSWTQQAKEYFIQYDAYSVSTFNSKRLRSAGSDSG